MKPSVDPIIFKRSIDYIEKAFFSAYLRWGCVFLERTRILIGIRFTKHFIIKFVVDMKRFVNSTVNAILTRQTCGQRSNRAAESKRRALENDFPSQFAIYSKYQDVIETEM